MNDPSLWMPSDIFGPYETITVSTEAFEAVLASIANPPAPSANLIRVMQTKAPWEQGT